MAKNSEAFYQASKDALRQAVSDAHDTNPGKFFFATLPEVPDGSGKLTVNPLFAYGARQRHEWMIPIRFLYFWAFYKDQKYWYRQKLCAKYTQFWSVDRLICDCNPAFHPNVRGENVYAESIKAVIPSAAIAGWKQINPASEEKTVAESYARTKK